MQQLLRLWNSLSLRQRISLAVAPGLLFLAVWGLVRYRHEGSFRSLYTGLSPEDASAITTKIREAGIEYRLDETGAGVSVPVARFAEARMALASAGVPRTGRSGWEIFDSTAIGISDFAEKVRLQRALEGELERTVATLTEVSSARIHLTFQRDSVFLDSRQPAKATVVLQLRRASRISQSNVTAIANLIASAVDGLQPDAVAIVDTAGHLLNRPTTGDDPGARLAEADLEYRRQVESGLATRIIAALDPVLGPDRYRTGISVDLDLSSSEENNETYDNASSAILTSQSSEESNSALQSAGTPGTASNLPRPPTRPASGSTGTSRRTENLTYQPSRIVRRVVSPRGSIRRISAAVVVDQTVGWEGVGPKARRLLTPPSAEVMKGVHDIVAGIVGFNEQRGDQLTVESVPFETSLSANTPPPAPPPVVKTTPFDPKQLISQPKWIGGIAGGVLLLFAIGYLLARRRKPGRAGRKGEKAEPTDTAATPVAESPNGNPAQPLITAEQRVEDQIARAVAEQEQAEAEALSRIALPASTGRTDVLVKHIRESIKKDPAASAGILRAWLAEKEARKA